MPITLKAAARGAAAARSAPMAPAAPPEAPESAFSFPSSSEMLFCAWRVSPVMMTLVSAMSAQFLDRHRFHDPQLLECRSAPFTAADADQLHDRWNCRVIEAAPRLPGKPGHDPGLRLHRKKERNRPFVFREDPPGGIDDRAIPLQAHRRHHVMFRRLVARAVYPGPNDRF